MPRQILFSGPQPPANRQFCTTCLMFIKGRANATQAVKDALAEISKNPDGPDIRVNLKDALESRDWVPELAVTSALSGMLGGIYVPSCWSHATGLTTSSLLPAGQMPQGPALLR